MLKLLYELQHKLSNYSECHAFWLAFSGGLDSTVLLHLLKQSGLQFQPIHINHQLQSDAPQWASHCQQVAAELDLNCQVIHVDGKAKPGQSPEEAARIARYKALSSVLAKNDGLFTAQHQNDQAETFLLQLFRGAGLKGLSSMPEQANFSQAMLLRPLLSVSQERLHAYAKVHQLRWVEDASNQDCRYRRNFIRHRILPIIQEVWPKAAQLISRSAKHNAEAASLLDDLAQLDHLEAFSDRLSVALLKPLSPARQRNLIRYWLRKNKFSLPSEVQCQQVLTVLLPCPHNPKAVVAWADNEIKRYHQQLYVFKKSKVLLVPYLWSMQNDLILPHGTIKLNAAHQAIALRKLPEIEIRFRQGGEKIKMNGLHRSLKKCFQQWKIPAWQRATIPLIYYHNRCVAVIGYGVSDDYKAESEDAIKLSWHSKKMIPFALDKTDAGFSN